MVSDGTPWKLCLARELIGAFMAKRVGLQVPEFGIVEIGDALIRSLQYSPEGSRLIRNRGLHFGSVVVDNVLVDAPAAAPRKTWAETLTFDALAYNADRKGGNPNVLWDGSTLYVIDHGHLAPTWTSAVDGLSGDSLYGEFNIRLHAGFPHLRTKGESFQPMRDAWVGQISNNFLAWARLQVPREWASPAELDELFTFLDRRATIADRQVRELTAVTQ
jgi:hypothetical protein